jgi:VIT1/CCC1 family predicted Fe2+/Mn2+ transporter
MTLTFTLGAGIIIEDEGREGARQLLIAFVGCNIAWGIIDGALYLVGELFGRGRLRRIGRLIRQSPTRTRAEALVADELDDVLGHITTDAERADLYRRIVDNVHAKPPTANKVTGADLMGALVSGVLVVLISIPGAIPFVVMDDARLALRVSNGILLALLFITGFYWARYTLGSPWIAGFSFLAGGVALVVIAIALGG